MPSRIIDWYPDWIVASTPFHKAVASATIIEVAPGFVIPSWRNLPSQVLIMNPLIDEEEDLDLSKLMLMNPPGGLAQLMRDMGLELGWQWWLSEDVASKSSLVLTFYSAQFLLAQIIICI